LKKNQKIADHEQSADEVDRNIMAKRVGFLTRDGVSRVTQEDIVLFNAPRLQDAVVAISDKHVLGVRPSSRS
jgi:hypothetical protein